MKDILILAATAMELQPFEGLEFETCVTGIGAGSTARVVTERLINFSPKLAIQVGIAGGLTKNLYLCESVLVATDYQGDLGAWRGDRFEPFESEILKCPLATKFSLTSVSAISVNTACTPIISRGSAQIETMEGAAFFKAAQCCGVDFLQLRTISNYTDQGRESWKIREAIEALRSSFDTLITEIKDYYP
ncbi:MAG: hypothetical protein RR066_06255 [Mucinivorans sp.]